MGVNIAGTNGGDNFELQARINKSNEAMTRLNNVWKNKKLDLKRKLLLHSSTVESILNMALPRDTTQTHHYKNWRQYITVI